MFSKGVKINMTFLSLLLQNPSNPECSILNITAHYEDINWYHDQMGCRYSFRTYNASTVSI